MRAWSSRVMAPQGPRFRVEKERDPLKSTLIWSGWQGEDQHLMPSIFSAKTASILGELHLSRQLIIPRVIAARRCGAQVNKRQPVELKIKGRQSPIRYRSQWRGGAEEGELIHWSELHITQELSERWPHRLSRAERELIDEVDQRERSLCLIKSPRVKGL